MKNGKRPTLQHKKLLKCHGLDPENWLIVKDLPQYIEVVSRREAKKIGNGKKRTRKIYKQE